MRQLFAKTLARELATAGHIRQIEISLKADRAAGRAEKLTLSAWKQLIKLIQPGINPYQIWPEVQKIVRLLQSQLIFQITDDLHQIHNWTRKHVKKTYFDLVPWQWLRIIAATKRRPIREDSYSDSDSADSEIIDWLGPVRKPSSLSQSEQENLLDQLLFPSPSPELIQQTIFATGWKKRLTDGTKLGDPGAIATAIANGITLGKTPAEIAKTIQPLVQNVSGTAKRLARTESLRVAAASQRRCDQGLGDMIVGYQIHATLDQNTRPEHAARNGTIYWKNPKSGQKGYSEMPHPPAEADGSTAWNCRCFLTAVLRDPGTIPEVLGEPGQPFYLDAQDKVLGDVVSYDRWFANADDRKRKLAVGSRKYEAVKAMTKQPPPWSAFIDPQTGSLLTLQHLINEPATARQDRIAQVESQIQQQRQQKIQMRTFGFIHSK